MSVRPVASDTKVAEDKSFTVPDVSVPLEKTVEGSEVYVYSKTRVVDP